MSEWGIGLPGWYGKVAFLGDFASRRLDARFVARWDAWLQEVIPASRAALGDRWLKQYLTSAVWRFIECDEAGRLQVGILMPSVDSVGRYYPLCVAGALQAAPQTLPEKSTLIEWLVAVESVALASLKSHTSVDEFDRTLLHAVDPVHEAGHVRIDPDDTIIDWDFERTIPEFASTIAPGFSVWWIDREDSDEQTRFASRGLPDARRFMSMLQANLQ